MPGPDYQKPSQTATRRGHAGSRWRVAITLFALSLIVSGGIWLLTFESYIVKERHLYRVYLDANLWKPEIRAEYDEVEGLLSKIEQLDPKRCKPMEAADLGADLDQRRALLLRQKPVTTTASRPHNFSQRLLSLVESYMMYVKELEACADPTLSDEKRVLLARLAQAHDESKLPGWPHPNLNGVDRISFYKSWFQKELSSSDETLRTKGMIELTGILVDLRKARMEFVQSISVGETVPEGLDLNFARKRFRLEAN